MGHISQARGGVGFRSTAGLSVFRSPHQRMGCRRRRYLCEVTFLCPISHSCVEVKLVLKERQLWVQQSCKEGQCSELFHVAAQWSLASVN